MSEINIIEHLIYVQSRLSGLILTFYESKRRGLFSDNPLSELEVIVNDRLKNDRGTFHEVVLFLKKKFSKDGHLKAESAEWLIRKALGDDISSLKYSRNDKAEEIYVHAICRLAMAHHALDIKDNHNVVGEISKIWFLIGIANTLTEKNLPSLLTEDLADVRRSNGGKKRAANYEPIKKQLLAHWLGGNPKTGKKWRSQASCAGDFLDILSESGLYHPSQKVAERWLSKAIGEHQKNNLPTVV